MKKFILSLIIGVLLIPTTVKADEGMWFLMFIERLNHRDMQKMGLQLTAEEIYSINNHSLKDAIVQFNGGCTAELISKDGLVLTNHHCGFDAIAELSTPEKDYLTNGYWAATRADELKPSSLFVRFFVRMDDVTKRILGKLNDSMSEAERESLIKEEITMIENENKIWSPIYKQKQENLKQKKLNKKILLLDNVPFELKQIENKVFYIIEKYKTKFLK